MSDPNQSRLFQNLLLGLQLMPVIAFLVALIAPSLLSHLLFPFLGLMGLTFLVLAFKFAQQVVDDFGRELYLSGRNQKQFERHWYDEPIAPEPSELEEMDRDRMQLFEYLAILGVDLPLTQEELTIAYRRQARITHPDAGGDQLEFIRLNQAYEALKNYLKNNQ